MVVAASIAVLRTIRVGDMMRRRQLRVPTLSSLLLFILLGGCGAESTKGAPDGPRGSSPVAVDGPWFDDDVEVASGRTLHATCSGTGLPAVIFLHGLIMPGDSASWAHAPELRARLAGATTYCEYERANVGRSSAQEGPVPVTDSVADLHQLIREVGLEPPVVLLGGSFGGLIAYTYAGTHPDDVAGVVILDPTLPDEVGLERAFLPRDHWLPEDAWRSNAELVDAYGAYAAAMDVLDTIPQVPGALLIPEDYVGPGGPTAEQFKRGIRKQQADLIGRFAPGRQIRVDAPHSMTSVVPDQIAEAVLEVIEAGSP